MLGSVSSIAVGACTLTEVIFRKNMPKELHSNEMSRFERVKTDCDP